MGKIFQTGSIIMVLPFFISCVTTSVPKVGADKLLCHAYQGIPEGSGPYPGMVFINQGSFVFGNDQGHQDDQTGNFEIFYEESGSYQARMDGFYIDIHEVTNAQFAQFVDATGYITVAERKPETSLLPPAWAHQDQPGSAVFVPPKEVTKPSEVKQWWTYVEGACWRHPLGPSSDIKDTMNHPVVHVAYEDAKAYADWAGKELPTEAQWEYAAKGGLKRKPYAWGDHMKPQQQWMANTFQGSFPIHDSKEDGYAGTAPVGCYPPNRFGLYDVSGNVWEIVTDRYQPGHHGDRTTNPRGPEEGFDPTDPMVQKHVIKGGSYLCSPDFCMRYRPSARQGQDLTLGTSHIGFRTVVQRSAKN
jgi:formylglycine-generating enzyme